MSQVAINKCKNPETTPQTFLEQRNLADPFGDGDCNIRNGFLKQAPAGDRKDALSH
jgi:hypothetical protein